MSVNLQKGQRISLEKEGGKQLKKIILGLGWDASKAGSSIDCDASAFLCVDGKIAEKSDIVCFYNLHHSSDSVHHSGDNLTGDGDGDDEQIVVDLDRVPAKYDKIILVVNIFTAKSKGQHFGMIDNAFIRIVDADNNSEFCKYSLTDSYGKNLAMVFGELYRKDGKWKFNAIGEGTMSGNISELVLHINSGVVPQPSRDAVIVDSPPEEGSGVFNRLRGMFRH